MARSISLLLSLALAFAGWGCASTPEAWLKTWSLDPEPRPGALAVCTSFACVGTAQVSLSLQDWNQVLTLFDPPPGNAPAERLAAARAVGLLEALAGARAGTAGDRPRDDVGGDDSGQLDCIAEAANTTVYLLLLERAGLLSRHRVAVPAHRGVLLFLSHSTAVLQEVGIGAEFALDSWYGSNGETARVWPLAAWKSWEMDGEETGTALDREEGGREGKP
ncbi:MAG: hypothetical protein AB1916_10575 [Thermodesulfobacteriota bacterium]